jgi:hypothetical protein
VKIFHGFFDIAQAADTNFGFTLARRANNLPA